ncbi:hypothetical protein [Kosakonia pseudosacchari]|uniref:hypothetical protein n=1 Tax=Kosakonia pseudosacchari TaxID=1646340 RepID=UPI00187EFAFA|nr:hypothetical protein [Kosakonia pseudosacchari]QOV66499.1 hypothetical protein IP581_23435 [Kosakonia pseudosacchari]
MNENFKIDLLSKKRQAKRKIWDLKRNLSNGSITQNEYDLHKSLLEDYIKILTLRHTRIFVEEDLINLSNHRSRTFTTTQHTTLVNKIDVIDYEIADLINSLKSKISNAQNSYPSIRIL